MHELILVHHFHLPLYYSYRHKEIAVGVDTFNNFPFFFKIFGKQSAETYFSRSSSDPVGLSVRVACDLREGGDEGERKCGDDGDDIEKHEKKREGKQIQTIAG
jgi:hypothetical protein